MLVYARRSDRPFADDSHDPAEAGILAETARPKPEPAPPKKSDEERISIFWRVFGGTLLSIVALVAITLFNTLNNALSEMRSDIARLNEARADVVKKDEFNARTTGTWDRVQALQTQLAGQFGQTKFGVTITGTLDANGGEGVTSGLVFPSPTMLDGRWTAVRQ